MSHEKQEYASDMTDAQWEIIRPLLPLAHPGPGRPLAVGLRAVVNAIFYVVRAGCQWENLLHEYPNYNTDAQIMAALDCRCVMTKGSSNCTLSKYTLDDDALLSYVGALTTEHNRQEARVNWQFRTRLTDYQVCRVLELVQVPDHSTPARTVKQLKQRDLDRMRTTLLDALRVEEAVMASDGTGLRALSRTSARLDDARRHRL